MVLCVQACSKLVVIPTFSEVYYTVLSSVVMDLKLMFFSLVFLLTCMIIILLKIIITYTLVIINACLLTIAITESCYNQIQAAEKRLVGKTLRSELDPS